MANVQDIINKYFSDHPIDIEEVKINYRSRELFKILDQETNRTFDLGVDVAKLYIKQN